MDQALALSVNYYRCKDDAGEVILSDRPCGDDAENLQLKIKEPEPEGEVPEEQEPEAQAPPIPGSQPPPPPSYTSLGITRPVNGGVERSIDGTLPIAISVTPALKAEDLVQIILDGKEIYRSNNPPTEITGVRKGRRSLQVKILDASGETLIQSETIDFIRF
jgi:hypothetical protein